MSESAESSLVGQTIQRYLVLEQIGEGGMGVVYEAIQDGPNRRVALKVIRAAVASSEVDQRFMLD